MMFVRAHATKCRWLATAIFLGLAAGPLMAALTGPTLRLDYGSGQLRNNPLGNFMYFIPLIAPEQMCALTNPGNTQCAQVTSFHCQTNGVAFHAVCEFVFTGDGWQRDEFDHAYEIRRRAKELQAGKSLAHQIAAISVQGSGSGSVEMDGTLTKGRPEVTEMRMRFNSHGHPSPVSVELEEISLRDGQIHYTSEAVARVNALVFNRASPPKMEVTLASVKKKDAADSRWQNFVGGIKGLAANFLLPPLDITTNGQAAMLDFGAALAGQKPDFTFPFATRLKTNLVTASRP